MRILMSMLLVSFLTIVGLTCSQPITISMRRQTHVFEPLITDTASQSVSSWKAGSTVPLAGGMLSLGFYYVPIQIGTPPQTFNLLLDSSSSNIAVSSASCDASCKSSDSPFYDPTLSSTSKPVLFNSDQCRVCSPDGSTGGCPYGSPYQASPDAYSDYCGYGLSFAGGSAYVNGYLGTDAVTFGSYSVNSTVVLMTTQTPSGALTSGPINGILGLAYEMNAVNPTWAPTLLGDIIETYRLPDMFSMCLNQSSGGLLTIGGYDPTKFVGSLQWIPIVQRRFYNIQVTDVLVGTTSLGLPRIAYAFNDVQTGSFFDSGSTGMVLSPAAMAALQGIFQSQYCHLPLVCGNNTIFTPGVCVPKQQMQGFLDHFPALVIIASGFTGPVKLSVEATSYFLLQSDQYCLQIMGLAGSGVVIGEVLLENYYVVHDRANDRLGVAPVQNCVA